MLMNGNFFLKNGIQEIIFGLPMKLTNKELIKYYYKLLKIRETELRIVKEYPNQEMRCPVHLSIGQKLHQLQ